MSPLALEMLIWFCTRAPVQGNNFPNLHLGPQQEILAWFHRERVVDRQDEYAAATEKARAWLDMICATPMPKQIWMDPRVRHPAPFDMSGAT